MQGAGFDYIIVGAGSAGCTLAHRLTEDGNARVLLIEAGGWDRGRVGMWRGGGRPGMSVFRLFRLAVP